MSKPRIVVTGYSGITPIGLNNTQILENVKAGNSGVAHISNIKCEDLLSRYGAEVKDFHPEDYMDKKDVRKMDRFSHFFVGAAKNVIQHSKLDLSSLDPYRIGCVLGVGIGGMESIELALSNLLERGWKSVPIMTISKIIANSGSANVAMLLENVRGVNYSINTACSSSTDAIGAAVRHLMLREADVMIVGGVEASITRFGIAGFNVLHALSTKWEHDPKRASRPFDKDRDGFVMGEGAAAIILETLESAQKRGATIYAEFGGYGNTCDAYHYTSPHPNGIGAMKAMQIALEQAELKPTDIDYINAHGTSTPTNDPIETNAIKQVFGEHAYNVNISSTKSMTGHCVGAAGMIEVIISLIGMEHGFIPPTINLENPDPECDLNYTPNTPIYREFNTFMSNTFGFGGHNGVVIFKKYV